MLHELIPGQPARVSRAAIFCAALLVLVFNSPAAIPAPEKLVPDDTLVLITTPDFAKLKEVVNKSPQVQFWSDPVMKPFRDSFMAKLKEHLTEPLERDLNLSFDTYLGLPQGQATLAITRNGWQGDSDQMLGLLFLLDTKDKSSELKTNLTELRKRWLDAGKTLRTEKIRDQEFSVVVLSSNDLPKTLRKIIPPPLEYHELGEAEKKAPPKTELVFGQVDSVLVVGNSLKTVEKIVIRLTGGTVPTLSETAAFDANQATFRDAPAYGWVNAKAFIDVLSRKASEKRENPAAPNPLDFIKLDKLFSASGLLGLKTVAFKLQDSSDGVLVQLFLGVPEANRTGLFKILAGEAKETMPPPFVPADAVKFQRWRLDGQKAWNTVQKMLAEIFPESVGGVNFILDTANQYAKVNDPGFDIKKNLFGNLGDDIITYEKSPRGGSGTNSSTPPSLLLLGSPNPEQLAIALKSIFVFMTAQSGSPAEREFLGRKIYSVPLPTMPLPMPGVARPTGPRTLNYCASGGYVAFSTDAASVEEYLRSSESTGKTLRESPGLTDAAQKVTGPGTDLFGVENQLESMRAFFELLKQNNSALANSTSDSLQLIPGGSALSALEDAFKGWMDFSLLPAYDKVAKYFGLSVYGGAANVDGLTYKLFAPVPPGLRAATAAAK